MMLTTKKILIVEDDETTRYILVHLLKEAGYAVNEACNGEDAFALLRTQSLPDLILLDLKMPVLSGGQFRERQRADPALTAIPVVVLSADSVDARETAALGGVGYLEKPVEREKLLAVLDRFLLPGRPEILVVEDEAGVLQMLDMALQHMGFAVRLAGGGGDAVELYRKHQDTVAMVLLDVQMPVLDGPGTLAALLRINPEVRCCFMSAHTGAYSVEHLLALGACRVLPKPFLSLAQLSRVLWEVIGVEPGR